MNWQIYLVLVSRKTNSYLPHQWLANNLHHDIMTATNPHFITMELSCQNLGPWWSNGTRNIINQTFCKCLFLPGYYKNVPY